MSHDHDINETALDVIDRSAERTLKAQRKKHGATPTNPKLGQYIKALGVWVNREQHRLTTGQALEQVREICENTFFDLVSVTFWALGRPKGGSFPCCWWPTKESHEEACATLGES